MKLFGSYTSPYVRHCRIVLLETHAECEFVKADAAVSAARSPTKRLPFMEDGDLVLTDSSAIVRHLRERAGQPFLPDVRALDRFCLINTALDTAANLFMLEKDGVVPEQSTYLARQRARIETCLQTLEASAVQGDAATVSGDDVGIRLVCFLEWTQFRQRLSLDPYPALSRALASAREYEPFAATSPHE